MKRIFHIIFLLSITLFWAWSAHSYATHTPISASRIDSILPEDSVEIDTLEATESPDDAAKPLSERLLRLLDNDIFDRTQVGIYVYDLTADTLIFA